MPAPSSSPDESFIMYVWRIGAKPGVRLMAFPRASTVHAAPVYIYTSPEGEVTPIGLNTPLCRSNTGFNHWQGRVLSKPVAYEAPYEEQMALRNRVTCGTCQKYWNPKPPELRSE